MSRKYTYSRSLDSVEGHEVFTAHEFDSFDEAQIAVEKGLHNRKLQLEQKYPANVTRGPAAPAPATPEAPAGQEGADPGPTK